MALRNRVPGRVEVERGQSSASSESLTLFCLLFVGVVGIGVGFPNFLSRMKLRIICMCFVAFSFFYFFVLPQVSDQIRGAESAPGSSWMQRQRTQVKKSNPVAL